MISISAAHNEARLLATKAFIDTGDGTATLYLYASARVADDVAPGDPLATIPLAYPCGAVAANELTLTAADGLVNLTGDAVWGRIYNRAGALVLSADVRTATDDPSLGEIVVAQRTHFAGGIARLVSAVLR